VSGDAQQTDWTGYLAAFHNERAGITEDVLEHAYDEHRLTPYDWAAQAVSALPDGATVLDLACGSAPMQPRLTAHRYLGLDASHAELRRASTAGRPVARANVAVLPVPDGSVDAVVMSMALMLVPLDATLREVARVLRPGGLFVATMPHNRPMPPRDWMRYARLCLALRRPGLHYPNDDALDEAQTAFTAAGLRLIEDEQRAFRCRLVDDSAAEQLLTSLYLPGVAAERLEHGRAVVHRWVGTSIATPIRRTTATRP
jgi:SAM-dependent methyltransferase